MSKEKQICPLPKIFRKKRLPKIVQQRMQKLLIDAIHQAEQLCNIYP